MLGENLKLLFRLYSHPHAASSEIMDRGSWLFAAAAVVLVSALWQFGVASPIYRSYQAPAPAAQHGQSAGPKVPLGEADDGEPMERHPLPLVGNLGWWFVSFSFGSVMASVLTLAALYVPFTLLVINLLEDFGSFSVVLAWLTWVGLIDVWHIYLFTFLVSGFGFIATVLAGQQATVPSAPIRGKVLTIMGHTNFAAPPEVKRAAYARMAAAAAAGELEVETERIALERVQDAWARLEQGSHRKILVIP